VRITKNLGLLLLGIWLLLTGLSPLLHLSFAGFGTLMAVLAVVAGLLLILER
jgi:hypothetical protein